MSCVLRDGLKILKYYFRPHSPALLASSLVSMLLAGDIACGGSVEYVGRQMEGNSKVRGHLLDRSPYVKGEDQRNQIYSDGWVTRWDMHSDDTVYC